MNTKPRENENSAFQIVYRVFVGMIFGFANIIPGVSGGTAMVVFGMYERIIMVITDFKNRIREDWKFFLPIVIGMGISIFLFGSIMDVVLTKHESLMQMFFIGVIVFSVPMIAKKSFSPKRSLKTDLPCVIAFLAMLGVMIWMAVAKAGAGEVEEVKAEGNYLLLALELMGSGALACATMIIPGISGSLVMVMIGMYGKIMAALHTFDLAQLIPFGIGMVIGLFACAGLIRYLLKRHERVTYSAILGFVVGSVFAIFPGWDFVAPVIAFGVGAIAIVACDRLAARAE